MAKQSVQGNPYGRIPQIHAHSRLQNLRRTREYEQLRAIENTFVK